MLKFDSNYCLFLLLLLFTIPEVIFSQNDTIRRTGTNATGLKFQSTQYIIPQFGGTSQAIPASGNSIILPYSQNTLKQIETPPSKLNRGEILLRRRFSATEYGLYIGVINPGAYNLLSAFKYPESTDLQSAVRMKFYREQSTNPDADIENIYFDADLFYLENTAKVFYIDSVWKELNMIETLPCRLSVASEPAGAQVFLNNNPVGATPVDIGAVYAPSAIIRLEMKGYFITENFLELPSGKFLEKKYVLNKKPVFDDGSDIDIKSYTAENTESVIELSQRIDAISEKVKTIIADSALAVQNFEKNYPQLTPKDQFEKSNEFSIRKAQYTKKYFSDVDTVKNQFHAKAINVLAVIPQIRKYRDEVKNREYSKYFDGTLLKLSSYNADSEFFPVEMTVDEKGFAFTFTGKLIIPRDEARVFYYKGTGSGKLVLTYKNWRINVMRNKGMEDYFVYLNGLKLRFKDRDYALKGVFTLSKFIEESAEYKEYEVEKSVSSVAVVGNAIHSSGIAMIQNVDKKDDSLLSNCTSSQPQSKDIKKESKPKKHENQNGLNVTAAYDFVVFRYKIHNGFGGGFFDDSHPMGEVICNGFNLGLSYSFNRQDIGGSFLFASGQKKLVHDDQITMSIIGACLDYGLNLLPPKKPLKIIPGIKAGYWSILFKTDLTQTRIPSFFGFYTKFGYSVSKNFNLVATYDLTLAPTHRNRYYYGYDYYYYDDEYKAELRVPSSHMISIGISYSFRK